MARPIFEYINKLAQADGDTRPYKGYEMRYQTSDQGERKPRHIIQTFDGGKVVGELNWYGTTGTIHHIEVEDGYYRQGIATAMWEWGQEMRPKPKHSGDRTTQGDAWARSVGGPIPRRNMASLHEAGSGPNSPEYRAAVEEHLAKAKAEGKADFGSTAEVRAYVERLLPPGVDVEVLVTHADRQGQMKLGAKAWVEKVNGRWRMSIKPEKAFKDVALHEVAHIWDVEANGWPQGGGEGIDLEQSWAHGPSFQQALRDLQSHHHAGPGSGVIPLRVRAEPPANHGDADYDSLTDEGARFWPSKHSAVGPSYQPFCVDCALERGFEHKDEAVPQRPSVDTCAACDQTKVCGYFRTGFNRDASSWRALVADAYWDAYDVTISSDGGASGRKAYEVHIGGKPYANRPSLAEAKLAVEQRFGAQDWRVVRVDKMTANHYHFGPTEEFTAPTTIWVADFA